MTEQNSNLLPGNTLLEIVSIKGESVVVKEMTYSEWLGLKKKKGFRYIAYQVGFQQFKK